MQLLIWFPMIFLTLDFATVGKWMNLCVLRWFHCYTAYFGLFIYFASSSFPIKPITKFFVLLSCYPIDYFYLLNVHPTNSFYDFLFIPVCSFVHLVFSQYNITKKVVYNGIVWSTKHSSESCSSECHRILSWEKLCCLLWWPSATAANFHFYII